MPARIQLSRAKGWRLPANAVNVARPTAWGNPYSVERFGRELALLLFEESARGFWTPRHFDGKPDEDIDEAYRLHTAWRKRFGYHPLEAIRSLRGKNLACWCKPDEACHADILLRLANEGSEGHFTGTSK